MIGCISGSFCDGLTMCQCLSPLNPRRPQPPWIPATLGALATLTTMTTAVRTPVERETVRNSSESCRNGKRKSWRNKKNSRNKRQKRIKGTNRWPINSIQVGFLVFVRFSLGRWWKRIPRLHTTRFFWYTVLHLAITRQRHISRSNNGWENNWIESLLVDSLINRQMSGTKACFIVLHFRENTFAYTFVGRIQHLSSAARTYMLLTQSTLVSWALIACFDLS